MLAFNFIYLKLWINKTCHEISNHKLTYVHYILIVRLLLSISLTVSAKLLSTGNCPFQFRIIVFPLNVVTVYWFSRRCSLQIVWESERSELDVTLYATKCTTSLGLFRVMYGSVTADVYNSAAVWWWIGQPLRKRVTGIVQWKEEEGFWSLVNVPYLMYMSSL